MNEVNTADELRNAVMNRAWFHRIDLGHGIITPGVDDTPFKLQHLGLPKKLEGMSVLDIGAYDGFFSFEAEKRGAARVLATDHYCWTREGMGNKGGFDLAKKVLNSRVEEKLIPVEELSEKSVGLFDLVLFLGVLYHSPDPLGYLRIVRSVCQGFAIIETHVDAVDYPQPAMVFYPKDSLNNDPSNFWGPNRLCVESLLYEVGFSQVNFIGEYQKQRMVFHALV